MDIPLAASARQGVCNDSYGDGRFDIPHLVAAIIGGSLPTGLFRDGHMQHHQAKAGGQ